MYLKDKYGLDCCCDACRKGTPTESIDGNVLKKCYDAIDKKEGKRDIKELIKEFIKPEYNFFTKKVLFDHLYYFVLGEPNLNRIYESIYVED